MSERYELTSGTDIWDVVGKCYVGEGNTRNTLRILNAHDDLVAALRGMLAIWSMPLCENSHHEPSEFHKATRDCPVVARHIAVMESAQQALAKAEGAK